MNASDFRRPLGLILSGGGSHGAWQTGCLQSLQEAGLVFDKVIGFSIGSITGAAYTFGFQELLARSWHEMERHRILRFKPRWQGYRITPVSLCSGDSLDEALEPTKDEAENKRRARCELTVISHRINDGAVHYARFSPGGAAGWDGPVYDRLKASCAIPWIFPPVKFGDDVFIDGGVPAKEPIRFEAMAGCADVIALQMVREEEFGSVWPWLRRGPDQIGRKMCEKTMSEGIESLLAAPNPPHVFRVRPSRVLDYDQLNFKTKVCGPAFEQGRRDGQAFLRDGRLAAIPTR